jgi:hypothetical protein
MTIVVLWYRETLRELWCAADTRISIPAGTATDNGPKILPVPVVCNEDRGRNSWHAARRVSFGFAYAGSTLTAMSVYAMATACTQNLASRGRGSRLPTVEEVARLFLSVAEHYIRDMSSRLGTGARVDQYFFSGMVFGYCLVARRYKAFLITPILQEVGFEMTFAEMSTDAHQIHPMGSGKQAFLDLGDRLANTHPDPGVFTTLGEMVRSEVQLGVGGHLQIGVCNQSGFRLIPILNAGGPAGTATVSFLGLGVTDASPFEGYEIGYNAVRVPSLEK